MKLLVALYTVNGSASTAEAVSASASANELIARIFHRGHNGEIFGHCIFFTEKKYINCLFHLFSPLIFAGKLFKLVTSKYGAVLANVLCANVASTALTNAALHTKLEGGIHLGLVKAECNKSVKGELDHDGGTAKNGGLVGIKAKLLNVVGNKANVTVPIGLGIIDSEMHLYACIVGPLLDDLLVVKEVSLTA